MIKWTLKKTLWLAALSLFGIAGLPRAEGPAKPETRSGRILLLHYRWHRDSLALVDKQWVKGAVKPVRGRSRGLADPVSENARPPGSPFSYELVSADGAPLSVVYLQDPGLRRVETQEKGDTQLRPHERKVDSADIFLRITDPNAKSIRFYRHTRTTAQPALLKDPAASPAPGGAAGSGQATESGATKTLLAEFPLD